MVSLSSALVKLVHLGLKRYKLFFMKYTVLSYNFNNYEIGRPILDMAIDDNIEYIHITDNPNTSIQGWKTIVDPDLESLSPFDKCYAVRFNLFKYASTDVCLYLDGSIQILSNVKPLIADFVSSNSDVGVMVHPYRYTMLQEYTAWSTLRGYDKFNGFKHLAFMQQSGYDVNNYKGLYQGCMRFVKRTKSNTDLDTATLTLLKALGKPGVIERLDQTIYSYLLNTKFSGMTIYPVSESIIHSAYMQWMRHGQTTPIPTPPLYKYGYVRNQLTKLNFV
jgi:hypothetical protein